MNALSESIKDLRTNKRQWEAFSTEGHCVVLAPPGSGKTKLLTTRMAYDLANNIHRPHGAACITLTNAAADELRRRVERLGIEGRLNLFIGTVHSFILRRIIEPFAMAVGRPDLADITIASKQTCDSLLREAISEVFPHTDARLVKSTIEFNRQRMASDEEWSRAGIQVLDAANVYENKLAQRNLHDFSGIIATAVHLVEEYPAIRRILTSQYPRLYIDEYQDLAPGLDRMVKALCFDYVNSSDIFAVGDPDQALFGFTGTRPELLNELASRSDIARVELTHNYRCGTEIIRVANLMRAGRSPITGDRAGGRATAIQCPGGLPDQYRHVIEAANDARRRGVPLHEIAVLCATRAHCLEVTSSLRKAGTSAFFRDTSEYRLTTVTGFIEAASAWAVLGRELSGYRLGDLLRRWRLILGARWTRAHNSTLTKFLMDCAARANEQAIVVVSELTTFGLEDALKRVALAEDALEVERMSETIQGLSLIELAERARKTDRVEVTTMTSSKGLEFDVVFIVGADEQNMPSYLSKTASQLAEDRRKFYVSITRARDELRIFYSRFVITNNGRRINVEPSRYLKEVHLIPQ
ncbi:ATP-dependent helicase [Nocardia sp. NPDC056541]|uniref:ATP-dependent helicase n=1 Tax=Nocardia sp. NPDC056541 TaxID=3345860 RepID=UPI00366F40EF